MTPARSRCRAVCAGIAALAAAWSSDAPVARAESPSQPASEAGVVDTRVREEAEERVKPVHRPPTIEQAPEPPVPPPPAEARFVLKDVALDGNTALPDSTFEPIIVPVRHQEITVSQLQALAQSIQSEYRRRGYMTTVAYVPPQRIEDGRVTIQVVEGRLGEVIIEGNRYFSAASIRRHLTIRPGEVLRYSDLVQSVSRMNRHPDREVQALLRAGKQTGTSDIVLRVTEKLPMHVVAQWDHQGTKSIGLMRYTAVVQHTNLLGRDDRAQIGTVFGRRFGAAFAGYTLPVTRYGTDLGFQFSHSQSSPGRHFEPLAVNGTSQTYSTVLTQPIVQKADAALDAQISFDIKENRTEVQSGTSRRDRLRVLRLGPTGRLTDRWGAWLLETESSFGLKWMGATGESNPVASRAGAGANFVKFNLDLTRAQRMPWNTQAVAQLQLQLASSKLVPQEQLYMGGANTVRGYPEGDYLADHGFILRLEYVVPCRFLPEEWRVPWTQESLGRQLQAVAFVDRGYGRQRAVTDEERTSRNMTGLGTGLRLRVTDKANARVEWAFNVGDDPLTDDSNSALHFLVQVAL